MLHFATTGDVERLRDEYRKLAERHRELQARSPTFKNRIYTEVRDILIEIIAKTFRPPGW